MTLYPLVYVVRIWESNHPLCGGCDHLRVDGDCRPFPNPRVTSGHVACGLLQDDGVGNDCPAIQGGNLGHR